MKLDERCGRRAASGEAAAADVSEHDPESLGSRA